MRDLIAGRRQASFGVFLGLVAIFLIGTTLLILTLGYREQVHATQSQLDDLKRSAYENCLNRTTYDQANHEAVVANARLYQTFVDLFAEVPPVPDAARQQLLDRQKAALERAQADNQRAAEKGVLASCAAYRPNA